LERQHRGVITQGGKEMIGFGRVGRFIYLYDDDGTVNVAYRADAFQSEACKMIKEKINGKAEIVNDFQEVILNGDSYIGVRYKVISERELIDMLNS
jgi:hypothetical protein